MEGVHNVSQTTHGRHESVFDGSSPLPPTSSTHPAVSLTLSTGTKASPVLRAIVTSTLNQTFVPVPTNFASVTTTLSGTPGPLLTASKCTTPYFASIRDSAGNPLLYPQIGCSYWYPGCCPFGWEEGNVLDHCAGNYTTQVLGTHSACCPV